MAIVIKNRRPWMKRVMLGGFILVLAAASIYWWLATEKFADTRNKKAAYTVNAADFIKEFQEDNAAANKKYNGKIITVNGTVSEIEAADTTLNLKFIDNTTGSYAIFAFQEQHLAEAKTLKEGDAVSVKASFSSGIFSDILGITSITFKRSALNK